MRYDLTFVQEPPEGFAPANHLKAADTNLVMREITYPSVERIVELNVLALSFIQAKRADRAHVMSPARIEQVLDECKRHSGDVYDKAVVLLKGIVQKHPFESGNRRTAFVATKEFLILNGGKLGIADEASNARILLGIRENYYADDEIKEWIHHGKIRAFER